MREYRVWDERIMVMVKNRQDAIEAGFGETFRVAVMVIEMDDDGRLTAIRTPLRRVPVERLVEIPDALQARIDHARTGFRSTPPTSSSAE